MSHEAFFKQTQNYIDIRGIRLYARKNIVPAAITATPQHNLRLDEGSRYLISSTQDIDITGISSIGIQGKEIEIINTGAFTLWLRENHVGSLPRNRFFTSVGDIPIKPNGSSRIFYDDGLDRWRVFAKESLPGPGISNYIDSINGVHEDGAGNISIVAAAATDIRFTTGASQIIVEPPDWHFFTFPPAVVNDNSAVVYGVLVVPAGKRIVKIRHGVRRQDDVADAGIFSSVTNETTTEEEATSSQYPTSDTFTTPAAAGVRVVIAVKNATVTPRVVFAQAAVLLENV